MLKNCDRANLDLYSEDNLLMYRVPLKGLYACPISREGSVSVSDGVEEIASCAFADCSNITEIRLPMGLLLI